MKLLLVLAICIFCVLCTDPNFQEDPEEPEDLEETLYENAIKSNGKKIRCYDTLSAASLMTTEPIHDFCIHVTNPKDFNKPILMGLDAVDTGDVASRFDLGNGTALLAICELKAFQTRNGEHETESTMYCYCRRNLCNYNFSTMYFLKKNAKIIQSVEIDN